MRAASLNYRDLLMVRGEYDPQAAAAADPGLGRRRRGRRRWAPASSASRPATAWRRSSRSAGSAGAPDARASSRSTLGGPLDGTLAELMVLDAEGAGARSRAPDRRRGRDAALRGVTAWNALVTHGGLRAGETVLVQGTGGVALVRAAVRAACSARARSSSPSSDEKLERARALGAWQTLNYRSEPEWGREVKQLTRRRRRGPRDRRRRSRHAGRSRSPRCAPADGSASIGMLGGAQRALNVIPIFMRQIRIQGVLVGLARASKR